MGVAVRCEASWGKDMVRLSSVIGPVERGSLHSMTSDCPSGASGHAHHPTQDASRSLMTFDLLAKVARSQPHSADDVAKYYC